MTANEIKAMQDMIAKLQADLDKEKAANATKPAKTGKNVTMAVKGNVLTITVDLTKDFGASNSGKSDVVASSDGFMPVVGDISINLNVIKKHKAQTA